MTWIPRPAHSLASKRVKPSNPDFLLRSHELLETVADACTVLAYEQGEVADPKPAVIQRICAVKGHNPSLRLP